LIHVSCIACAGDLHFAVHEQTDQIAQEAARLMGSGGAATIGEAIRAAALRLRLHSAPMPSPGLVRRHAQGMAMQALGSEGHREMVRHAWRTARDIMCTLEDQLNAEGDTLLLGRGATGHFDADAQLHLRMHTAADIGLIAACLVEGGYAEPTFDTVETRLGRLNRVRLVAEGIDVTITRLPPSMRERGPKHRDLHHDRSIEAVTLVQLQRLLDHARHEKR
jgi:hypothetical protein